MVILGLLLNKTSQQGKKAVKGDRGNQRRYSTEAINMPEGKRRQKQKRTCYLSTIARDWFLCFSNHSNLESCPAPFPTPRLTLDSVQKGSNDTAFQTYVCYFNSLKPHCRTELHACCAVQYSWAAFLCPIYSAFQPQKDEHIQLKPKRFWLLFSPFWAGIATITEENFRVFLNFLR